MLSLLKKFLKASLITKLKDSELYHKLEAKELALTSKRLDICAAQVAHLFHLANINSLAGKSCLEVGSGWTLSHSIIFHLLGAKKVYSTDLFPYAQIKTLRLAINNSITSLVRDILSPFEPHHLIRKRLDNLLSIQNFSFDTLRELGIEYIAPIDFKNINLNIPVDFIYSNSVFEHIPIEDLKNVLVNLARDLTPNGIMINCIHLEDHSDFKKRPFDFLSIPSDNYSRDDQSLRGNRIRKSTWEIIFNNIPNTRNTILYEWTREDIGLPGKIDKSIMFRNETDLRTSHLGIMTQKTDV